jgi:exodeoxyribonuclease VII large subunit
MIITFGRGPDNVRRHSAIMAREGDEMADDELLLPWAEDETGGGAIPGELPPDEKILTVSEVNRLARQRLEAITVTVQGEVSKLTTGYAYYVYFDLRDTDASLPAIMTQQQLKGLGFDLEEGASVVVRGNLTLYERQGKYQVRVIELRPFGEGEIQRRIEELKKRLQAEGLFDDARKMALPAFPERIGVVTSPRGAAVRDVVVTLGRRFPPARVFLRGVRVQGTAAVRQICAALDFFDAKWPVDVVVLARGGGSLQDLEPFNSEEVARAIARMRVPLVSGIGHEPDVTIADLVADRRASTPTGAAEAVVPDRADVRALLAKTGEALRRRETAEFEMSRSGLEGVASRPLYRGPEFLLGPPKQRWERAAFSLPSSPRRGVTRALNRLSVVSTRPVFRRVGVLLAGARARLESRGSLVSQSAVRVIERQSSSLEKTGTRLSALSPLAVLDRGYSITFDAGSSAVIRSSAEVATGDSIHVRLAKGTLDAEVTGKGDPGGR